MELEELMANIQPIGETREEALDVLGAGSKNNEHHKEAELAKEGTEIGMVEKDFESLMAECTAS